MSILRGRRRFALVAVLTSTSSSLLRLARAAAASTCAADEHGFSMDLLDGADDISPPESDSCKTIYFVRHAEGIHNRDSREIPDFGTTLSLTEAYRDSPLTPRGIEQCAALAEEVRGLAVPPEIVIVSPLRRAIHTAQLGFRPSASSSPPPPPFLATELARERISVHTCDWRRPRSEVAKEFPFVDLSEVATEEDEMWLHKEVTPAEYSSDACRARAAELLHWLLARPERTLAVVAHWVFYTHLFGLFKTDDGGGGGGGATTPTAGGDDALQAKFGNAEMRRVRLCGGGGGDSA